MFCFNFQCFRLFDYIIVTNGLYRNALYNSVLYKNYSFHFVIVGVAHIKAQTFEHLAEYQFHAEKHHKTGGNSYLILSCEYARAHILRKEERGLFVRKLAGFSPPRRAGLACAASAQEGRHQGFYPLVNHPFPKRARRKLQSGDRCEMGNGSRVTLP